MYPMCLQQKKTFALFCTIAKIYKSPNSDLVYALSIFDRIISIFGFQTKALQQSKSKLFYFFLFLDLVNYNISRFKEMYYHLCFCAT